MSASKTRIILALAMVPLIAACVDQNGVYEADADRSACNPSYSEFYTGAGSLPVRCTAQTATFW